MDVTLAEGNNAGHRYSLLRVWQWHCSGGDILLLAIYSLGLKLYIGQEQIVSKGDPIYWFLIVPVLVFPALRWRQTLSNLLTGVARPFSLLGIVAGIWGLVARDYAILPQLVLIVWVAGWATRKEVRLNLKVLLVLFLVFYVVGIVKYYSQPDIENYPGLMRDYIAAKPAVPGGKPELPDQNLPWLYHNAWGVLPGQTAPAYGPWRISVTPNIFSSGIISMLAVMLTLNSLRLQPLRIATLSSGLYFAILAFVRSILIALVLFAVSQAILRIVPSRQIFIRILIVFGIGAGAIFGGWIAPYIIHKVQDVDLVSRLFLRGEYGLSLADVYRQIYRPWLWQQHFQLFLSSDYLMGQGSELGRSAATAMINYGQPRSDGSAFPTRLLATYGLPALALVWFIGERCLAHAKANDIWALSALPALVWLMMTWGAAFHPTNIVYVLALLIIARGGSAFFYPCTER